MELHSLRTFHNTSKWPLANSGYATGLCLCVQCVDVYFDWVTALLRVIGVCQLLCEEFPVVMPVGGTTGTTNCLRPVLWSRGQESS